MKKKLKCKELLLTEDSQVEIISLVKKPAIEVGFMKFSEQEVVNIKFANEEKMILTGPALIPDKLILRQDESNGEYFNVFFSAETIEKIAQQYLKMNYQHNVNIEHNTMVDDVCLYESWIIEDSKNDKSNALGYELPKGTWMVSMKVNNKDVWNNLVKTGDVEGFSIEGQLAAKLLFNEITINEDEILLNKIIDILKDVE